MTSQEQIDLLKKKIAKLEKLVYLDSLTNLYNRRGFTQLANNYLKTAFTVSQGRRKNELANLALIFLDLDDFKKINDKFGHQTGDRVLKAVAKLLKKSLRTTDLIGRWGGEEFVILLTNVSQGDVLKVAQKLQAKLTQSSFGSVKLTASFGLIFPKKFQSLESLINQADKLMYQAKKSGKNQIKY